MIVLDTHIWVWWVAGDARLAPWMERTIEEHEQDGLGVSMISCWEVAKLVEIGKLGLDRPIEDWVGEALDYPGVRLLDLTVSIVLESTKLPPPFHRDPADQIIVATARVIGSPLLTRDARLIAYPHVQTMSEQR